MLISEFVYIYLLAAFTQVRLHKFVQSAFWDYKKMAVFAFFIYISLQSPLFRATKFEVSIFSLCCLYFLAPHNPLFPLEKFVVSNFSDYKSLQCALFRYKILYYLLFDTTKVCSVCFLSLQCALFHYKSLYPQHCETTKVCSIRFLRL